MAYIIYNVIMDRRLREMIRKLRISPGDVGLQQEVFNNLLRGNYASLTIERFTAALMGNMTEDIELARRGRRRKRRRTKENLKFEDGFLPLQLCYVNIYGYDESLNEDKDSEQTIAAEKELLRLDNLRVVFMQSLIEDTPQNQAHMKGKFWDDRAVHDDLPGYLFLYLESLYLRILNEFATTHRHHLESWMTRTRMLEIVDGEIPPIEESLATLRLFINTRASETPQVNTGLDVLLQIFNPHPYPPESRGRPRDGFPEDLPELSLELHCFQKAFHALVCGISALHIQPRQNMPEVVDDEGIWKPHMVRSTQGETQTALFPVEDATDTDEFMLDTGAARIDFYLDEHEPGQTSFDLPFAITFSNAIAAAATSLMHLQMCEIAAGIAQSGEDKDTAISEAYGKSREISESLTENPDVIKAAEAAEARLEDLTQVIADFDERLASGRLTRKAVRDVYRVGGWPDRHRNPKNSFSLLLNEKQDIQRELVREQLDTDALEDQLIATQSETVGGLNQQIREGFKTLHPFLLEIWVAACLEILLEDV